jgi:hypothetical protein
MEMVLTEREWMLLDLLLEQDQSLFACAMAVREATTDSPDHTALHLLPDPRVREHTLAALMTLYQAGFIELLRGTLAVRPDGTIATGRKRGVPRVETLRLLLAEHPWHRDHGALALHSSLRQRWTACATRDLRTRWRRESGEP